MPSTKHATPTSRGDTIWRMKRKLRKFINVFFEENVVVLVFIARPRSKREAEFTETTHLLCDSYVVPRTENTV